jgi:starch synthase
MSHILPLYLKKAYIDDPIFSNSKVVVSFYEDTPAETFPADTMEKVLFGSVTKEDVSTLENPTGTNLAKLAASYADGIIFAADKIDPELEKFCRESGLPVLDYNAEALSSGSYIDDYNSFYDNL